MIPDDTWRTERLPAALAAAASDADALEAVILVAMQAGCFAEVRDAVRHLQALDAGSERAQLAAALLQVGDGDEAAGRRALEHMERAFPQSTSVKLQLSRLDARDGQPARALDRARQAVLLDPNGEVVFTWCQALLWQHAREQGSAWLERLAAGPTHWRAQVAFAEHLLDGAAPTLAAVDRALSLLRTACTVVGDDAGVLAQVVRSLGARGLERHIVVVMRRVPEALWADPECALFLARGQLRRGDVDAAAATLAALEARAAPEAAGDVAALRAELDAAPAPIDGAMTQVVPIEGPVWAVGLGNPAWLEHARGARETAGPVGLLAWSVAIDAFDDVTIGGMVARAMPLALTEALWAGTTASPWTLLPMVGSAGFVRWTLPPPLDVVAACSRMLPADAPVVVGDLCREDGALRAELFLLHPAAGVQSSFVVRTPDLEGLLTAVVDALIPALVDMHVLTPATTRAGLLPPLAERGRAHLGALDTVALQLLEADGSLDPAALTGVALAAEQLQALVAAQPKAASPVLLLGSSLLAAADSRPHLVPALAKALRAAPKASWLHPLDVLVEAAEKKKRRVDVPGLDPSWTAMVREILEGPKPA